jgi:hypothetical protein
VERSGSAVVLEWRRRREALPLAWRAPQVLLWLGNLAAQTEVAQAILSTVRWQPWLAFRRETATRSTRRRGKQARGWCGRVKLLIEGKDGQKSDRGGGDTCTESLPEAAMAAGLALECARWVKEERERGSGGVWLGVRQSEGGGGGDPVGVARSRLGVPTSSCADATEAGGSRVERSCGSRGKGRVGPSRREREEGRERDRWARFSNLIQI